MGDINRKVAESVSIGDNAHIRSKMITFGLKIMAGEIDGCTGIISAKDPIS